MAVLITNLSERVTQLNQDVAFLPWNSIQQACVIEEICQDLLRMWVDLFP